MQHRKTAWATMRSMNITHKGNYYKLIIVLGALAGIMPLSIDMYLPAFSKIANGLGTDVAKMGITLSSFFAGVCIGQLVYGPLMDKFGRLKPLFTGMSIFLLASIASMFVQNLEQMAVVRFLQAFGGCASFVANRAIARDLFPGKDLVKVFSMLMLIIGIAPILAPTIGSFIVTHYHWHTIFVVLSIMAALLLCCIVLLLSETKSYDPSLSLRPSVVASSYFSVLKHPIFLSHTLSFSFASAALFAYISASPFVFMTLHGLTEQQFGWAFGFNASCLILGSQINRILIKKYNSNQIATTTAILMLIIASCFWVLAIFNLAGLAVIITCLSSCMFLIGIFNPNASAIALSPFVQNAGIASGLSGFCQMGINALASFGVSHFANGTVLPMTSTIFVCIMGSFLALIVYKFAYRK